MEDSGTADGYNKLTNPHPQGETAPRYVKADRH
jgi:hypothetical protein